MRVRARQTPISAACETRCSPSWATSLWRSQQQQHQHHWQQGQMRGNRMRCMVLSCSFSLGSPTPTYIQGLNRQACSLDLYTGPHLSVQAAGLHLPCQCLMAGCTFCWQHASCRIHPAWACQSSPHCVCRCGHRCRLSCSSPAGACGRQLMPWRTRRQLMCWTGPYCMRCCQQSTSCKVWLSARQHLPACCKPLLSSRAQQISPGLEVSAALASTHAEGAGVQIRLLHTAPGQSVQQSGLTQLHARLVPVQVCCALQPA